ncbi:FtsW/RodA/SpoVE family cell cycle protein [Sporolactobacillus sp. CQH2019]|uniref:FtsW/RodA/SpoVE family cell cycle protein n=1 Tax=Sporolactobacillus sp. CQH2019 TaxID=3023512 RepID=UPI002368BD22|nr:FtsW/RodA/SpoVE family cell cycle protein [Sporolactobacillus sp. CQH2019]MDD9149156.1 FtsW/RodA/SpoVE family cell cycle protein [Sporolactobacillus sp. CQH2019]
MVHTLARKIDLPILLIVSALAILSIVFIHSSQQSGFYGNQNFALKQGINYAIGIILLVLFVCLDSDQIEKLAWPFYLISFAAIVLLPLLPSSIAPYILGAKRWYSIPFLGSLQPSEFFKVALLILAASIAGKHHSAYPIRTVRSDFLLIAKILLITLPPSFFVYVQPDTGMVFLYLAGSITVILMSGVQKKIILFLTMIPAALAALLMYIYFQRPDILYHKLIPLLSPHQQARIVGWLSPAGHSDQSYQAQQALIAVGSGELGGKGIGKGNVYIPEKPTDFIFASIAEEGGFLVVGLVIFLFILLMYRMLVIACLAESLFGTCFCSAAMVILALQIFQNIGMNVGLMPVKGISLPFLSYGGSSVFSNMILIGILLSIRKSSGNYLFRVRRLDV